jgi:Holliday junction resolvasome RuvABC endonuclease subunit
MLTPAPARTFRAPASTPGLVTAGFDPGIGSPGITVVRAKAGGGYEHLHSEVVRTKSGDPDDARYDTITDALSRVLREFAPAVLIIEAQAGVQTGKRREDEGFTADSSKTHVTVGIARAVARIYRVPSREVQPRTLLAAMGIKSKKGETKPEKKRQMQRAVEVVLGVKLAQDAADASGGAIYGQRMSARERMGR